MSIQNTLVGRLGRRPRSVAALTAAIALSLAACGSSSDAIDPALVGATGGGWALFPHSGNGGYDVSVYDWDLTLSDDLTAVSGVATLTAAASQDLQQFSLDARGLQVESVTVDDEVVDHELVGPELVVTMAEPLPTGSDFVVRVDYAADPTVHLPSETQFRGWDVIPGEQVFVVGLPGAAATWTPIDEDLDAPPARYVMRLDVPDGFAATASGVPTVDEETGEVVWDTGREVYGATFAIGDYETTMFDGPIPIEVSAEPGSPIADRLGEKVPEFLTFLESLFGPFPYERVGLSIIETDLARGFAYSTPMRIVTPGSASDLLLVHELAHQWIGNAVSTDDETSNWLFEGLATYVEALWAESQSDDLDVESTTRTLAGRVPAETRPLDGIDSIDDVFDDVTYQRGALLYHALRLEIGDDAFFTTVHEFTQRNLHRTVRVDDLQVVAEEVSGRDLDQFFAAWVSERRVPPLPDVDADADAS